jgi:putative phosphoribosyl transferase
MWADRIEAGRLLGDELVRLGYAGRSDTLVLGIPRGGVETAAEVARRIRAPLDVVVVRKVGAPGNPEYAAGAVDPDGTVYPNPDAPVGRAYLQQASMPEHAEALRRIAAYRGNRPPLQLVGRTVIVVDDGIATGLTALAALSWLRARGATEAILAAPVMAPETAGRLADAADRLVVLASPLNFYAVGAFYRSFPQLSDEDVTRLLASSVSGQASEG